MTSFAFIKDYLSKFTWIHNHVINFNQFVAILLSGSSIILRFSFALTKRIFVFPGPRTFAWPPALCLVPSPGRSPQFAFTGPGQQFYY